MNEKLANSFPFFPWLLVVIFAVFSCVSICSTCHRQKLIQFRFWSPEDRLLSCSVAAIQSCEK